MPSPEYPVFCLAITIEAPDNVIHVEEDYDGGGIPADAFDVEVPPGVWYLDGSGVADDLCKGLKDALDAASLAEGGGYTYTVAFEGLTTAGGPTGRVTISSTAPTFGTRWDDAATTFDAEILGFINGSWDTLVPQVSTNSPKYNWMPNQPVVKRDPAPPSRQVTTHEAPNGVDEFTFAVGSVRNGRRDRFELVYEDRVWGYLATAQFDTNRAFETWWGFAHIGTKFRYYRSSTPNDLSAFGTSTLLGYFTLEQEAKARMPEPERPEGRTTLAWDLPLHKVAA